MIYVFLFLLLLYGVIRYDVNGNIQNRLYYFYYIVLLLTFVSGLSYRLGADTVVYMAEYDEYKSLYNSYCQNFNFLDEGRQLGWVLLLSIVKTIGGSFSFLKLLCSLWINFVYANFIFKHTKYVFTALLLYYFAFYTNSNFEIMRESISISFFLLAFDDFLQKKWLKYYLYATAAFLFHESAIFLFLLPLFSKLNIAKHFIVYGLIVLFIAFYNFDLNTILANLLYIDVKALDKLEGYLLSENYGTSNNISTIKYLLICISCVLPLFSFYVLFKNNIRKEYAFFAILYAFICALMYKMPIFLRFNNYIIIIILILYVDVFVLISKKIFSAKYIKWAFLFFVLCYCMYKSTYYMSSTMCPDSVKKYSRYYPYSSIFTKKIDEQRELSHRTNLNR
ncbi:MULTISPECIES: EpsG family protein [Bacteroides]|uniref:EpsG family protein n=1 Tax=Bacteroides TaxID=816 RepID=UPI000E43E6AC|nr:MULTISPECIES: EpsG family protein [Bacteroides]MBS7575758.1 EpsG family protein [Bacteroides propionicigenes]RGM25251.1 EpsG family protein [Bacteroides sp. OM08-17BH]HBO05580.1 hypothetical protein [Bacteroides sp.]